MKYIPQTDTAPLAEAVRTGAYLCELIFCTALLIAWGFIALDISRHQYEYGDEVRILSWVFLTFLVLGGVLYAASLIIERIAERQFQRRGPDLRVLP